MGEDVVSQTDTTGEEMLATMAVGTGSVGAGPGEPAETLEQALTRLDEVVEWAIADGNRIGFFAAMYRKVTRRVKERIAEGSFQDGLRMERLTVTFANRYLEALERFRRGEPPSRCWAFAFETTRMWRPLVLQHLLLGINAHINLDLGIAAARTSPGDQLPLLREDFNEVNWILERQVGLVREEIGQISPWIRLLSRVDPTADRALVNFSILRARDQAWTVAELLACLPQERWKERIDVLDRNTVSLARLIRDPLGWVLRAGMWLIRLREKNDVRKVIRVLDQMPAPV